MINPSTRMQHRPSTTPSRKRMQITRPSTTPNTKRMYHTPSPRQRRHQLQKHRLKLVLILLLNGELIHNMEVGNIKLNWKNLMWRDDIFIMPKMCGTESEERYVTAVTTDFLKKM